MWWEERPPVQRPQDRMERGICRKHSLEKPSRCGPRPWGRKGLAGAGASRELVREEGRKGSRDQTVKGRGSCSPKFKCYSLSFKWGSELKFTFWKSHFVFCLEKGTHYESPVKPAQSQPPFSINRRTEIVKRKESNSKSGFEARESLLQLQLCRKSRQK